MTTGLNPIAALSLKPVPLYSDLLLHDMGELGDGIPDGTAGPRCMRPPPLWGLPASAPYLHDGRAPTADAPIKPHARPPASPRRRHHPPPRLETHQPTQLLTPQLSSLLIEHNHPTEAITCLQRLWPHQQLLSHQRHTLARWKTHHAQLRSRGPHRETLPLQTSALITRNQREMAQLEQKPPYDAPRPLQLHHPRGELAAGQLHRAPAHEQRQQRMQ